MTEFQAGTYIILPKGSDDAPGLGIGPVPLVYPPLDVPVRVLDRLIDRWIVKVAENNTFSVFAGRAQPNDYKWIVKGNDLFVSSVRPPDSFRFESAGDNLWTIGIFGEDALLTYDDAVFPALTFKPADGSDAQRFQAVRIDRA